MIVSCVIIFYNQPEYVHRAVRSVLNQSYQQLDIIVVDDGSDESIEPIVRQFGDDRIRFFRKENGGAGSARNFGIQNANGEYIAFLDGDDIFLPTKIEELVRLLEVKGCPECVATTGAYVVSRAGHCIGRVKPKSYKAGDLINSSLVRPSCSIYHKSIFEKVGGFPEHMMSNEDGALNTVIAQRYPIYALRDSLVLYQEDTNGLARKNLNHYERAVEILGQRLAFVESHMSKELFACYSEESVKNLLFGFLSNGNGRAAKQWFFERNVELPLLSVKSLLARFSLMTGLNLYFLVWSLFRKVTAFFFILLNFKKFFCLLVSNENSSR